MDAQLAGQPESRMLIELNVSLHTQEAHTHFTGLIQRIFQQLKPIPLSLVIRMNAYRSESPGRLT